MSFFWPTKVKPDPGVQVRAGRVVHYLGAVAALILILVACYGAYYAATTAYPYDEMVGQVVIILIWAVGVYAVARGLRYVLSSE